MNSIIRTAVAMLLVTFFYVGCGGSSGGGEIEMKGQLAAADYTTASRFRAFDPIWAALVEGVAYAAGISVSEVWALPLYNGEFHPSVFSSVKRATPTGGTISLNLSKSNWVVLLIDGSAAAKKDQVAGYVTMTTGSAGLTGFPMVNAASNIDLGTLTKNGEETSSSKNGNDNAAALSLTVDQLTKLAETDGPIKNVKNAYRNYDGTTFLSVKPFFVWRWSSATSAISNSFSDVTTLVGSKFHGYLFYLNSNHSGINYSGICAQSTHMTLTPPSTVANVSGDGSWGPSSPLTSAGTSSGTSGNSCGAGALYLRDDTATYGSYQFNFSAASGGNNEYLAPPIPSGDWTLKVGSTTIGAFEGNLGTPFADSDTTKPMVFIPSLKANVSGSTVTSVELKWYQRNSSTGSYALVTDASLLDQMQNLAISLTDYSASPRSESRSGTLTSSTGYSFTPTTTMTVRNGLSIDVDYTFNNVAYHFEHRI